MGRALFRVTWKDFNSDAWPHADYPKAKFCGVSQAEAFLGFWMILKSFPG